MIVDSDDYEDQDPNHNCLPYLVKFKEKYPKFKITLWAIPGLCTEKFLADTTSYNWIELGIHGLYHKDNYEFANLSITEAIILISQGYKRPYFKPMFKAPGWQISDGTYRALMLLDMRVMDQHHNNDRRPEGLSTVIFADEPTPENRGITDLIHTHTWQCCGNWLEEVLEKANIDQDTEFQFISEIMTPYKK